MKVRSLLILLAVLAIGTGVFAQEMTSSVTVSDQIVSDQRVTIDEAFIEGDGFVVIHIDNGEGAPGPVIGHAHLADGMNESVDVKIDTSMATSTLFAMLHTDTGEMGVYEFGQVEGADGPVRVDDSVVVVPFGVQVLDIPPQMVEDTIMVNTAIVDQDGFVVIHQDNGEGAPGTVIGFAPVSAGTNLDVMVEVDPEGVTNTIFPMLHVDTGEAGVYEFGQVEGADGPVRVNDSVFVFPVSTVPTIEAYAQNVTDTLTIDAVLAEVDGFVVIHQDNGEGAPGPVIGFAPVSAGTNLDVMVEVDPEGVTETVFPMLHVDTGEAGVYEFGQVEGADGPVRVNDSVVVVPMSTSTMMMME